MWWWWWCGGGGVTVVVVAVVVVLVVLVVMLVVGAFFVPNTPLPPRSPPPSTRSFTARVSATTGRATISHYLTTISPRSRRLASGGGGGGGGGPASSHGRRRDGGGVVVRLVGPMEQVPTADRRRKHFLAKASLVACLLRAAPFSTTKMILRKRRLSAPSRPVLNRTQKSRPGPWRRTRAPPLAHACARPPPPCGNRPAPDGAADPDRDRRLLPPPRRVPRPLLRQRVAPVRGAPWRGGKHGSRAGGQEGRRSWRRTLGPTRLRSVSHMHTCSRALVCVCARMHMRKR